MSASSGRSRGRFRDVFVQQDSDKFGDVFMQDSYSVGDVFKQDSYNFGKHFSGAFAFVFGMCFGAPAAGRVFR